MEWFFNGAIARCRWDNSITWGYAVCSFLFFPSAWRICSMSIVVIRYNWIWNHVTISIYFLTWTMHWAFNIWVYRPILITRISLSLFIIQKCFARSHWASIIWHQITALTQTLFAAIYFMVSVDGWWDVSTGFDTSSFCVVRVSLLSVDLIKSVLSINISCLTILAILLSPLNATVSLSVGAIVLLPSWTGSSCSIACLSWCLISLCIDGLIYSLVVIHYLVNCENTIVSKRAPRYVLDHLTCLFDQVISILNLFL